MKWKKKKNDDKIQEENVINDEMEIENKEEKPYN